MRARSIAYLAATLLVSAPLWPQVRDRDPLTEKEVDQLREAAIEPEKRLKLMVDFTRARMLSVEQLRSDPKEAKDRGKKIHDLLEDVSGLVDEIDDNVENYNERNADLRKPLKEIVQMNTEFQLKLRELRAYMDDPKNTAEADDYKFAVEDVTESVNQSADSTRKLLDEQNVKFADKKKKK
jgi:regulator of replication initiation timing